MPNFQAIAERINTGTENPDTSRALVVFNCTSQTLSGVAVFRASFSWPRAVVFPAVVVIDSLGNEVISRPHNLENKPDTKGRHDRWQISFDLRFLVSNIPAQGWHTYYALYADVPDQRVLAPENAETPGLVVVETTRHGGDLAIQGRF